MTSTGRQVALVTGAAGSLGRVIAAALVERGAFVVGLDLSPDVESLSAHVGDSTSVASFVVDICDSQEVSAVMRYLERDFGRLDVLVNNAAIDTKVSSESGRGPIDPVAEFAGFSAEAFTRTLATNVVGSFMMVQACLPLLRESRSASIVNIASIYGVIAPNQDLYADSGVKTFKGPDYPASKAALISFSAYVAATLGHIGIRSNAISPGGVDLGQPQAFLDAYAKGTPLARLATPQDVANAVVFLSSAESGYVTGHNLVVDGGRTAW